MKHGDTFVLKFSDGEDQTEEKFLVVNPQDETITHVVRARQMHPHGGGMLGPEFFFSLAELEAALKDDAPSIDLSTFGIRIRNKVDPQELAEALKDEACMKQILEVIRLYHEKD